MKLVIQGEHSDSFTSFDHSWVGVVDLSNLYISNRITPQDEAHFISSGLYPWYGICGGIVSIQEVES
jgi:hypothetical protein